MTLVISFDKVDRSDINLVGGKTSSLGELISIGQNVPGGFAITTQAYELFLQHSDLNEKIADSLSKLNADLSNLLDISKEIRKLIFASNMPKKLEEEILSALRYETVAIRSSGVAEDLPTTSFAGMHETYLNVPKDDVIETCKKCVASLYTERAIAYRQRNNISHDVLMSVAVQEMVNPETSGVLFTADVESGFEDVIMIESIWGLGETIVAGQADPDTFMVYKGKQLPIIDKKLGSKSNKTIVARSGTKKVETTEKERDSFTLSDNQIISIAKAAKKIEDHYKTHVDIEWAFENGKLYILQARPLTTLNKPQIENVTYSLDEKGDVLVEGLAIGSRIASGEACVIKGPDEFPKFSDGDVLVTEMTNPDWMHLMMKASAIVTDKGGRTSHSAIISRELGIPCIVGTKDSTKKLKGKITVSCSEGETGRVYAGELKFSKKVEEKKDVETKTEVLMNINFSDMAFIYSTYPSNGVGMVRQEMLILENVGVHPKALLEYNKLKKQKNTKLVNFIDEKTKGYDSPTEFYIERLSLAMGKIAAAFYPREVIVKLNDFKSNEYKHIPGGDIYEPREMNPIIGWRSARYYSDEYKAVFGLECEALRRVREEMGFENIHAMVPFCRTPEEGQKILDTIAEFGLIKGKNGFKIICEVEVPVSIILMEEYNKLFDGYQIGSNCLTQSILCLDKDNPLTNHLFDERHPAMKKIITEAIKKAHGLGKKIGIVGQAPSDFPEFTEFLVKEGIDSISLNPDPETFIRLREKIADAESY